MLFEPPPGPPPLLTDDQILYLARQGHLPLPIPERLKIAYAQLFELVASDLFTLTDEQKTSLYPVHGTEEIGYRDIIGEKQFVTFRHASHPDTKLEVLVQQVWHETSALLHRVMYDLARALGSLDPETLWQPILDKTKEIPTTFDEGSPTFLRLFEYLPDTGISDQHTDLGLLTLCVYNGKGLQVRAHNGTDWEWQDPTEPTLLIGSTLAKLLQSKVRPGLHRVVANPQGRSSAIFALRPNLHHQLDMSLFGGEGMMDVRKFWRDLIGGRYNVNAPQQVRQQQKEKMAAQKAAASLTA